MEEHRGARINHTRVEQAMEDVSLDAARDRTEDTAFSGRVGATFKMLDDRWVHQASV